MVKNMEKINSISYLRALACIGVIILHTFHSASGYAVVEGIITDSGILIADTVRNLMMWAVPCFVMVSGQLLLNPKRNVTYKKIFKQYILRIAVALLAFTFIFEVYDSFFENKGFTADIFLNTIKNVFTDGSWSHMWYLYLIIAIYLMLPFFRSVAGALTKKDSCYLLTVYMIFLSVLPLTESITGLNSGFYICTYTVYPLYLFGGYIVSQKQIFKSTLSGVIMLAIGTAAIIILSVIASEYNQENTISQLKNYSFIPVVIQSFGIYIIMTNSKCRLPNLFHIVLTEIDKCSFGMYLVHLAVLKTVIAWIGWNPYNYGGTITVLLLAVLVTIVSYCFIRVLKLIPVVKKII